MKKVVTLILSLLLPALGFPQGASPVLLRLEVSGIRPGGGTVFAAVFDSPEGYRQGRPLRTLSLEAAGTLLRAELQLPPGEYVLSVFQDTNGNGKLDTNFLGIPREPVGISNYNGKGPPGGFDKQKIRLDSGSGPVTIRLAEI